MSEPVMSVVKRELHSKLREQIAAFNKGLGGDALFGHFEDEKNFHLQLLTKSSSFTISRGPPDEKPDPVYAASTDDMVTVRGELAFEFGNDSREEYYLKSFGHKLGGIIVNDMLDVGIACLCAALRSQRKARRERVGDPLDKNYLLWGNDGSHPSAKTWLMHSRPYFVLLGDDILTPLCRNLFSFDEGGFISELFPKVFVIRDHENLTTSNSNYCAIGLLRCGLAVLLKSVNIDDSNDNGVYRITWSHNIFVKGFQWVGEQTADINQLSKKENWQLKTNKTERLAGYIIEDVLSDVREHVATGGK